VLAAAWACPVTWCAAGWCSEPTTTTTTTC
jgi:hypothetical protein